MDDDRMISGVDMEFGYDTWRVCLHNYFASAIFFV